ncbi:DUF3644 domain-containing protein [Aerococcaceae bacterium zg-ZUI334]|uniref:DUF3644 domain-containing protein n=1 Tax=Aerococcaceae bacterium zg-252 TaxID=2796928 RepID=UPI001BA0DE14|nr:DUF3644 domain-containing protein [Aerococcaceae bacterium zg-ZUI334]
MENLPARLVDKSIEAFIMGLEIYNKPTIKYRIEGFSFFICNAWELMLKARIIKENGEEIIYYKDSNNRTISLENAIELIFPDKHGSLRKNLLKIIELRNTSTHFITEDFEHIYAPLFQACVNNFISKMDEFHSVDITQYIAQNFLTLSVRIDQLSSEQIIAKYSPEMAEKLLSESRKIEKEIDENNSDYAIPVQTRFYITKRKQEADLFINIDKKADTTVNVLREVKNPNDLYPLTTKDIVRIVNKQLKVKGIMLTKYISGQQELKPFTTTDFQLFLKFYDIKKNEKYCFHYRLGNRYGYSQSLCDFLIEEISKDPVNFVSNLKKYKKIR